MATKGPQEIPVEEGGAGEGPVESGSTETDPAALDVGEGVEESEAAQAVQDDIAALRDEIDGRDAEIERLQDRLLRLQADFDNYRRREMRARTSSSARAKGEMVRNLLTVLDDMRRVAGLDPSTTSTQAVIDGVRLVERKLLDQLSQEGLDPVGRPGEPFDPNLHEAIGIWPAPKPQLDGKIAAVPIQGYRFNEQLLRPAQVQVYEHRPGERGPDLESG